jgi:hypothetical protein
MHDGSTARRWRAAAYLGLISSTFSTVVSQLSAARIGRDASVDWMSVAGIPARDWALTAEPSTGAIAVGIAFHQWADFSWALVFFGVLGKWTADRHPAWLAVAAARDLRLRLMAHAIRHGQQGEIAVMHSVQGGKQSRSAFET